MHNARGPEDCRARAKARFNPRLELSRRERVGGRAVYWTARLRGCRPRPRSSSAGRWAAPIFLGDL